MILNINLFVCYQDPGATEDEWISGNKIVLNVSKTNYIVFGSYYFLGAKPTLNLYINEIPIIRSKKQSSLESS